jgi:predicted amidohydrolase
MRRALTLVLIACAVRGAMPPASRLRVAVVQMALGPSLESNRDRIVSWTAQAAARGARVAVFPEGALSARSETPQGDVPAAVGRVRAAARAGNLYVLFGGWTWSERHKRNVNWMKVIAPDGREVLHYDKLWEIHDAPTPALFFLDGVPASVILCADRWLRAVEDLPVQRGALISFELSNNFDVEWVPELEWYWYVPRALRNSVWVVFANTGNPSPGEADPGLGIGRRHGHSAIIAPDGSLLVAERSDTETMLVADLDISRATRAEALARGRHPVLGRFWRAGLEILSGQVVSTPPLAQKDSATTDLSVAAAQIPESVDVARNAAAMIEKIAEAARRGADLVAFPELVLTGGRLAPAEGGLQPVCQAAKAYRIAVVFGAPWRDGDAWRNSAFVVGPEGTILTRYDQLAARTPFAPGTKPAAMWFQVKGVPAVVTIGREALWNEIAELAAVAGARLHVNISREPIPGPADVLRRRQIGAALGSFGTLTIMANAGGHSAIWDDLRGGEEARAVVRGLPPPDAWQARIFSPFSANLVVEAGAEPQLILAKRRIPGKNAYHPQRTANYHPAMRSWYELGASLLSGRSGG